jgi:acyl carrier protein phosphodiesterase
MGIKLHRAIDEFTDSHPIVKDCTNLIKNKYGRYSGIVIDVFFDFFLAVYWTNYSSLDLKEFTQKAYKSLNKRYYLLPNPLKELLPTIIHEDWLYNYGSIDGLNRTFLGLTNRIDKKKDLSNATNSLIANYDFFDKAFQRFFPELIEHVRNYRMMLL